MSLKALSQQLKLSPTTVSRALNGYPEVSEATRERVLRAARRMHYAPNRIAAQLATGRAMAIGHVMPVSHNDMSNPIFADFIAGAGEVYSRRGYDMLISVTPADEEKATYRRLARRRSVDGVIVHGPRAGDPRFALLEELRLPYLIHGRSDAAPDSAAWLDVDNRRAFARATRFLTDLGHRRIALLNGLPDMNFAQRRAAGYFDALRETGIAPDPGIVFHEEMTEPYGFDRATLLLSAPSPPTAFLTASSMTALGVARALGTRGLTAGRDVSIVTWDDQLSFLPISGAAPMFTTCRSSIRAAGKRCAEMLIELIECPDTAERTELWEAELTLGNSTGPAPRA
ncbi:MAG: substrate-binding domain-containing protein [Paracoccaceae bacterium]